MITATSISDCREFLIQKETEKSSLEASRTDLNKDLVTSESLLRDLHEARVVLNSVAVISQDKVKEVIERIVTKALQTVFSDIYVFKLTNEVIRNKSETFLKVVKNGHEMLLKDDPDGGGLLDVVSFVLRVVLWALEEKRSRNTIILDEPGKNISKDKRELFGLALNEISKTLNLQFILVSHEDEYINVADKAYRFIQENGVTRAELVL